MSAADVSVAQPMDPPTSQSIAHNPVENAAQHAVGQPGAPPPPNGEATFQQQATGQILTTIAEPAPTAPPQGVLAAPQPSEVHNAATASAGMSTAANPSAPYISVNATTPLSPSSQSHAQQPAYIQRAGGSRFIPYQPPVGPPSQAASSAPAGPRQAIIAPPVKAPRQRKRAVKTSEFVEEDGRGEESISQGPSAAPATTAGQQQQQDEKENGVSAAEGASSGVKKRTQDVVKITDYIKPHVRVHVVLPQLGSS